MAAHDRSEQGTWSSKDPADGLGVTLPMTALTIPSEAELGLLLAAKYESEIETQAVGTRRRLNTVGVLSAVAVLVFGYDAVSLIMVRR
jgi:hypothetical protein